jgi:hypothetical protein
MAPYDEDNQDLYDDEFDFVDDDDDDDEEDDQSDLDDESELDSVDEGSAEEDDAESELDAEPAPREAVAKRPAREAHDNGADEAEQDGERDEDVIGDEEPADEYSRSELPANFRVHVYEFRQYKRTIDRPFTAEDAEAFASEYNRTSKPYGRFALAGKEDAKPRKMLD